MQDKLKSELITYVDKWMKAKEGRSFGGFFTSRILLLEIKEEYPVIPFVFELDPSDKADDRAIYLSEAIGKRIILTASQFPHVRNSSEFVECIAKLWAERDALESKLKAYLATA